jgi:hypothetical protein
MGRANLKRKAAAAESISSLSNTNHDNLVSKQIDTNNNVHTAESDLGAHVELEDDELDMDDAEEDTIVEVDHSTRNAISGGHPRGVKPLGNLLMTGGINIRTRGLGPWLGSAAFTDESILDLLKSYCLAPELVTLSCVSKALYVFANEEELWRGLTLEQWNGDFRFVRDWKNTYALMTRREGWRKKYQNASAIGTVDGTAGIAAASAPSSTAAALPMLGIDPTIPEFPLLPTPLKVNGFYSDFLFQAFYCSHIDLLSTYGEIPTSRVRANAAPLDTIPRVHVKDLTVEQFRIQFGIPNRPCIIQGLMDNWPCYAPGPQQWNEENWLREHSDVVFKVGKYSMPFASYMKYMKEQGISPSAADESPLYLFDSKFGEKIPKLINQYQVPKYFNSDLFSLLEPSTQQTEQTVSNKKNDSDSNNSGNAASNSTVRPSYRWILVGPARSGSTFHKDPNHTSAWNALISGRKKWIMYPIHTPPPGVFPSDNQAEVTTPISVTEWFINFYAEHRKKIEEFEEKKAYEIRRKQYLKENAIKTSHTTTQKTATAASKATAGRNSTSRTSKRAKISEVTVPPTVTSSPQAESASPSVGDESYPLGPIECICEPGEVIFIPNGWWHTALNLTPSFAVTQNYVNHENVWNVIDFLQTDAMEVDRNLALLSAFENALEKHEPEIFKTIQTKKIEKEQALAEVAAAAAKGKKKSSLWELLTS